MKKFLLLLSLIMLAACNTRYKDVDTKSEQIQAMLFSQNKFYLLGKEQDYQFKSEEKNIPKLQSFWESPLAKKANIKIESLTVYDNNKVFMQHAFFINMAELTEQEIRLLEDKHDFHQSTNVSSTPGEKVLILYTPLLGKLVKLAKRKELLAKYALPTPVDTEVTYTKTYYELDKNKVITIIALPIIIPAMLIGNPIPR